MGLEVEYILSDERHHDSYLCMICQNLCGLDALVTTGCSHVFCRVCLETWVSSHGSSCARCPTCNRELSNGGGVGVGVLSKMQPLAYRVLTRIKVSCPLAKHGCCWNGDYGDLQEHLLSSSCGKQEPNSSHQQQQQQPSNHNKRTKWTSTTTSQLTNNDNESQRKRSIASSFKQEGNNKFSAGNYSQARDLYTKGLSILINNNNSSDGKDEETSDDESNNNKLIATLKGNRAAALMHMRDYKSCIDDCQAALTLDPSNVKVFVRLSKAWMELGNFREAYESLRRGCDKNPVDLNLRKEFQTMKRIHDGMNYGIERLKLQDYGSAKASFSSLLRETSAFPILLGGAKSDLGLGLIDSALRLSLRVIRADDLCAEAYEIRGVCMFLMGDYQPGLALLRQSLRLDPDSQTAKTKLRNYKKAYEQINATKTAMFQRHFKHAVQLITATIDFCKPLPSKAPLYSALHSKRAEAHIRQKNYKAALEDCILAINSRDDCIEAWVLKAKAYHGLDRDEDAKNELADLLNRWGAANKELQSAYDSADFEVRKKKRPNFYNLFGVPTIASEMEIKKAYKQRAKDYHPDRFSAPNIDQTTKLQAEENFKLLGAGLEILCDDFKRQLYDKGYDEKAIRERVEMAKRAANYSHGHCPH